MAIFNQMRSLHADKCADTELKDRDEMFWSSLEDRLPPPDDTLGNSTLQHTEVHCNTLQQTVLHCNTLQRTATDLSETLRFGVRMWAGCLRLMTHSVGG